ncbi:MAG: GWxTD domain-containing protein [Acidobacteriia bacterium]|nr:GWxTD domain-containing protein [Terriglobia bacterium]
MPRIGITVCCLALALVSLASAAKLPPKYAKWLDEDVIYIITSEEKKDFQKLTSDEARDKFIEEFWEVRNPARGAKQNSYKEEHYRRIEEANQLFGRKSNTPGWMTDMGKTWIEFGKPESRHPFTGYGQIYPLELWFYSNTLGDPALPPFFYVLFFMPEDIGEYRYYRPSLDTPMKLVRGSQFNSFKDVYQFLKPLGGDVAHAALSLIPSEPIDTTDYNISLTSDILVNRISNFANEPFNVRRIRELRTLRAKVTSWFLTAEQQPLDIETIVLTDPVGQRWLDYAVSIPEAHLGTPNGDQLSVSMAYRLTTEAGELIAEDEERRAYPAFQGAGEQRAFRPFQIAGRLPLIPGSYKLAIEVNNRAAGKSYRGEKKIAAPGAGQALLTGPLFVASVERAGTPDPFTPFQYFGVQFHPAPRRISSHPPFRLLFEIDLPEARACELDYVLGQINNRDVRKTWTDKVDAAEFRDGRLLKSKTIPLTELEPGDYRLAVNLHAAGSPQVLASATVPVKVTEEDAPTALYFLGNARQIANPAVADYLRALEALAQKDDQQAALYLRQALDHNPANTFAGDQLVHLYFNNRQYGPVGEIYRRFGVTPFKSSAETMAQITVSLWQSGDAATAKEVLRAAQEYFPQDPLVLAAARSIERNAR